ncbi:immune-associated nucleotide-binding protein 11-like [Astyanax mexicanus]|uniref:Immune-associated nucleotide-binding protein 11-like n=1 Tax=Astyanax mexicanus TaxID=7994 RepID=A0A8T2LSW8_ASTMX|nr:immune-associated nucleotide-binding protein 11-like [Astyanax mexicanus]
MAHRLFDDSSIVSDFHTLFDELHIVLIGCHYAGKNTVGNAILRKHVFKYKTTYERHNAKRERAVFGRRITIVRVPGWYGDLDLDNGQPEINQEIRDCMKEFQKGPHAIILCVTERSTVTNKTMKTLESLLTDRVWDHTLIVFTKGKNLKTENIDKHIKDKDLQVLWETCGKRHHILTKWPSLEQSRKLIEDIEEMVAKKSISFTFSIPEMRKPEEFQAEKSKLLERIQDKINLLEKDASKDVKRRARGNSEKLRLKDLQKHVEETIQLQSQSSRTVIQSQLSTCSQADGGRPPCDTLMFSRTTTLEQRSNNPGLEATLGEEQSVLRTPPPYSYDTITLRRPTLISSPGRQDLRGWGSTLVNVLEELKDQQFDNMKCKIGFRNEWKIARSKLDGSRADVAELMIQTWGEYQCIINIRDIMKDIPRNDQAITSLLMPFLEVIGETW